MQIRVNVAEAWKLRFDGSVIHISNEKGNIQHELEGTTVPHLVDYIRKDGSNVAYVWGFIEDNMFVIENRMPNLGW